MGELLRSATEAFLALLVDTALGPSGSLWLDASHLEAAEAAIQGAGLGSDHDPCRLEAAEAACPLWV